MFTRDFKEETWVGTPAANTAISSGTALAALTKGRYVLLGVDCSFDVAPAAATEIWAKQDTTFIWRPGTILVGGPHTFRFGVRGIPLGRATMLDVTLGASGDAGTTGYITVLYGVIPN